MGVLNCIHVLYVSWWFCFHYNSPPFSSPLLFILPLYIFYSFILNVYLFTIHFLFFCSSISAMFSSSISFLHLNIQSLVPKLDLITAEYADFDILSFSESWLNRSHTDTSLKLSNYQTSFRKDSGPNKSGVGLSCM
jgi:hypothetical protein